MGKILILSASTGGGHNRAAHALKETFEKENIQVDILDTLKFVNPTMDKIISKGYEKSAIYTPKAYGRLYKYSDLNIAKKELNKNLLLEYMVRKLKKFFKQNSYDFIIGTHPFPLMAVSKLKEKNILKTPVMSILTDYTIHSTWVCKNIDYYITGDEFVKSLLIREGIDSDDIHPFGIPVESKFLETKDKKEVLDELGLFDDKLTVLLMGGSFGAGNVLDEFNKLLDVDYDIQIIAVAGRNKSLKDKLQKAYENSFTDKKVLIYGFTKNINNLMNISDILVTKPGGLTTTEALLMEIPLIIPYFIPGQEGENLDFLLNNGLALKTTKKYDLKILVEVLIENPHRLKRIKENMNYIKKLDSSENIYKLYTDYINSNLKSALKA